MIYLSSYAQFLCLWEWKDLRNLWIKRNNPTLEPFFYISKNIMSLGITYQERLSGWFDQKHLDFRKLFHFKRYSGVFFIRFHNSRFTLPVFYSLPSFLLCFGIFKRKITEEGNRGPATPLTHNETTVYPKILCTFIELGPVS